MSSPNPVRSESFEIGLLADYPEAVRVVAAGYEAEWDFWYGSGGRGDAKSDLLERSQIDRLPLGLIARRASGPIGAIALAANAITPRPELSPLSYRIMGCAGAPQNGDRYRTSAHRNCQSSGVGLRHCLQRDHNGTGFFHARRLEENRQTKF